MCSLSNGTACGHLLANTKEAHNSAVSQNRGTFNMGGFRMVPLSKSKGEYPEKNKKEKTDIRPLCPSSRMSVGCGALRTRMAEPRIEGLGAHQVDLTRVRRWLLFPQHIWGLSPWAACPLSNRATRRIAPIMMAYPSPNYSRAIYRNEPFEHGRACCFCAMCFGEIRL